MLCTYLQFFFCKAEVLPIYYFLCRSVCGIWFVTFKMLLTDFFSRSRFFSVRQIYCRFIMVFFCLDVCGIWIYNFQMVLTEYFPGSPFFSVRQIYGRVIYLRFFFCKADLWQIYYFLFRSVCVIWFFNVHLLLTEFFSGSAVFSVRQIYGRFFIFLVQICVRNLVYLLCLELNLDANIFLWIAV